MLGWFSPDRADFAHHGGGWPSPKEREKLFKGRPRSLRHYFDASVTLVPGIATQTKRQGFLYHKVPKTHSLDYALHRCMEFVYFVSLVLSHVLHHSILEADRIAPA